ncbi:Glycosyltransferase involved in cell wall bisynthesis [Desulfacinum hydrothermale DSM 13146]|uniref:Glycosyltransferase involved in cell wall bisynthesis n=1 Tax=Desulfacinum hydrothermale DSM 13146 TaxID=1121390 RepID=A0A1W1XS50_9BACT|nr:glycosyltransferase family 4 protein [Desulfacinum hydrothermale]SMC26800.1 Glycosyltransferase involved in cell wall bisynthesis [Desulfacinum hydrothermale DSM 13146]
MGANIGFVSSRFAGSDGVTLEASKWANVLKESGHERFWWGGEVQKDPARSMVVPEAHFNHPNNVWINQRAFGTDKRSTAVTDMIHASRALLKGKLLDFLERFQIDLLVVENSLASPAHIPLGLALAEVISENQMPTIAHHHEFYWEQSRYTLNAVGDLLSMAFPPHLPTIQHVVINSAAQEALAHRMGISAFIIPNVLDFAHPPSPNPEKGRMLREKIGLDPEDKIVLQPSRVIRRKGIEHAMEVVKALKDPRYKLVITHEAGTEDKDYAQWLKLQAREHGVDVRYLGTHVVDPWAEVAPPNDHFSLFDLYPHADLITYPSLYEGFGNAFLEALYFRKPLVVNRYSTFIRDIEPLGFDLLIMDGYVNRRLVEKIRDVLQSPERRSRMVEHNYQVARRHFSYQVLRKRLSFLLLNFFGMEI